MTKAAMVTRWHKLCKEYKTVSDTCPSNTAERLARINRLGDLADEIERIQREL